MFSCHCNRIGINTWRSCPSNSSTGGRPLQASADQNRPSLLDHVTSSKHPDLGLLWSRTFSRKHQTGFKSSLSSVSILEPSIKCRCEWHIQKQMLPGTVSSNGSIIGDLKGIISLGTPTRVSVFPVLLSWKRGIAQWRLKEIGGRFQKPIGWRSAPVRNGARHCRIDALSDNDCEAFIVAFPSWK